MLDYKFLKSSVILKLGMGLSLVFLVSSLGIFLAPMVIPAATIDTDNGIGGMAYSDASLVEPEGGVISAEGDPQDMGIPEPESFSRPRMLLSSSYKVQPNDNISTLAQKFGLNEDTLLSLNGIKNARLLRIGDVLKIPNQDGILYTVKKGDTLDQIAEKYKVDAEPILAANELFSDTVHAETVLFVPGARMEWMERQEINGDLFQWPVSNRRITSPYGYRISPITNSRMFHAGLDIASPMGAPIRAAMSGRVTTAGWSDIYGYYVVITHHAGYRTLYGHMNVIRVKRGDLVGTGQRIGDVGSTGQSTGPHLHFTVYKNGVTVSPRTVLR